MDQAVKFLKAQSRLGLHLPLRPNHIAKESKITSNLAIQLDKLLLDILGGNEKSVE
jgi:hypothetical protein